MKINIPVIAASICMTYVALPIVRKLVAVCMLRRRRRIQPQLTNAPDHSEDTSNRSSSTEHSSSESTANASSNSAAINVSSNTLRQRVPIEATNSSTSPSAPNAEQVSPDKDNESDAPVKEGENVESVAGSSGQQQIENSELYSQSDDLSRTRTQPDDVAAAAQDVVPSPKGEDAQDDQVSVMENTTKEISTEQLVIQASLDSANGDENAEAETVAEREDENENEAPVSLTQTKTVIDSVPLEAEPAVDAKTKTEPEPEPGTAWNAQGEEGDNAVVDSKETEELKESIENIKETEGEAEETGIVSMVTEETNGEQDSEKPSDVQDETVEEEKSAETIDSTAQVITEVHDVASTVTTTASTTINQAGESFDIETEQGSREVIEETPVSTDDTFKTEDRDPGDNEIVEAYGESVTVNTETTPEEGSQSASDEAVAEKSVNGITEDCSVALNVTADQQSIVDGAVAKESDNAPIPSQADERIEEEDIIQQSAEVQVQDVVTDEPTEEPQPLAPAEVVDIEATPSSIDASLPDSTLGSQDETGGNQDISHAETEVDVKQDDVVPSKLHTGEDPVKNELPMENDRPITELGERSVSGQGDVIESNNVENNEATHTNASEEEHVDQLKSNEEIVTYSNAARNLDEPLHQEDDTATNANDESATESNEQPHDDAGQTLGNSNGDADQDDRERESIDKPVSKQVGVQVDAATVADGIEQQESIEVVEPNDDRHATQNDPVLEAEQAVKEEDETTGDDPVTQSNDKLIDTDAAKLVVDDTSIDEKSEPKKDDAEPDIVDAVTEIESDSQEDDAETALPIIHESTDPDVHQTAVEEVTADDVATATEKEEEKDAKETDVASEEVVESVVNESESQVIEGATEANGVESQLVPDDEEVTVNSAEQCETSTEQEVPEETEAGVIEDAPEAESECAQPTEETLAEEEETEVSAGVTHTHVDEVVTSETEKVVYAAIENESITVTKDSDEVEEQVVENVNDEAVDKPEVVEYSVAVSTESPEETVEDSSNGATEPEEKAQDEVGEDVTNNEVPKDLPGKLDTIIMDEQSIVTMSAEVDAEDKLQTITSAVSEENLVEVVGSTAEVPTSLVDEESKEEATSIPSNVQNDPVVSSASAEESVAVGTEQKNEADLSSAAPQSIEPTSTSTAPPSNITSELISDIPNAMDSLTTPSENKHTEDTVSGSTPISTETKVSETVVKDSAETASQDVDTDTLPEAFDSEDNDTEESDVVNKENETENENKEDSKTTTDSLTPPAEVFFSADVSTEHKTESTASQLESASTNTETNEATAVESEKSIDAATPPNSPTMESETVPLNMESSADKNNESTETASDVEQVSKDVMKKAELSSEDVKKAVLRSIEAEKESLGALKEDIAASTKVDEIILQGTKERAIETAEEALLGSEDNPLDGEIETSPILDEKDVALLTEAFAYCADLGGEENEKHTAATEEAVLGEKDVALMTEAIANTGSADVVAEGGEKYTAATEEAVAEKADEGNKGTEEKSETAVGDTN